MGKLGKVKGRLLWVELPPAPRTSAQARAWAQRRGLSGLEDVSAGKRGDQGRGDRWLMQELTGGCVKGQVGR